MLNEYGQRCDQFTDWASRDGAAALRAQIVDYWRARGRVVKVEIAFHHMEKNGHTQKGVWTIRSNLVGGMPA